MTCIDDIPQEMLEHIFTFVAPYDDFKTCKMVCKRWYHGCVCVEKRRRAQLNLSLADGTLKWDNKSLRPQKSTISGRYSHSACIHGCDMYVFGGCTSYSTTFNDLWKYDLNKNEWIKMLTGGIQPSPKSNATMLSYKSWLVLFGGWNPSSLPLHYGHTYYNELHVFNIETNKWGRINNLNPPPPLAAHSASIHNNLLVVFGGYKHEGSTLVTKSNDIFCFDLEALNWFQPIIGGEKPQPRYGHSQVKMDNKNILIIGGCGGQNNLLVDVWLLTLPSCENITRSPWVWSPVSISDKGNLSVKLLCNPTCKVADTLVALLPRKHVARNSTANQDMRQLLLPSSVRRQPLNYILPHFPNVATNPATVFMNLDSSRQQSVANSPNIISVPARTGPSIRPNASYNRERRLLGLTNMETRLSCISRDVWRLQNISKSYIVPHLLDLKNVVSSKTATWLPISVAEGGMPKFIGKQPNPRILYSLLLGENHLIMFGGIPNRPSVDGRQCLASNQLSFVSSASR